MEKLSLKKFSKVGLETKTQKNITGGYGGGGGTPTGGGSTSISGGDWMRFTWSSDTQEANGGIVTHGNDYVPQV